MFQMFKFLFKLIGEKKFHKKKKKKDETTPLVPNIYPISATTLLSF